MQPLQGAASAPSQRSFIPTQRRNFLRSLSTDGSHDDDDDDDHAAAATNDDQRTSSRALRLPILIFQACEGFVRDRFD